MRNLFLYILTISILSCCSHKEKSIHKETVSSLLTTERDSSTDFKMKTLYKGAEILPYSDFYDFSFEIFYNEQTKIISARSLKKAGEHIIEYRILMKFLGKKYDRESFSIYDDSQYEYYKSLILIDNEEIDLTPVRLVNTKDDIASPFFVMV